MELTRHQRDFKEFLINEKKKRNSSIISEETFSEIKEFLTKGVGSKALKKRVRRQKFNLVDYPNLGLRDLVCVPSTEVSERNFLLPNKHVYLILQISCTHCKVYCVSSESFEAHSIFRRNEQFIKQFILIVAIKVS